MPASTLNSCRMSTRTKTEACLPGASPEVVKKEKAATSHTSEKKKEKTTISSQTTNQALPATTQKNKINQPHIRLALSRADTLAILKSAPKRKRCGITPDSCGKAGDPHDLEGGALASRNSSISKKRRRDLDAGWDLAAEEAGSSADQAVLLA